MVVVEAVVVVVGLTPNVNKDVVVVFVESVVVVPKNKVIECRHRLLKFVNNR